jgi:predicted nucleic acid-binding protein
VLLATVEIQELWAGVSDESQARDLTRLYELARSSRTLLNPPAAAWVLSGRALGLVRAPRRCGPQRLRTLRNDALLAATAFLAGATVLTENEKDFELLNEALASLAAV